MQISSVTQQTASAATPATAAATPPAAAPVDKVDVGQPPAAPPRPKKEDPPAPPPKPTGPFTSEDVDATVKYFKEHGRVYRKSFFFWKKDLESAEAAERLGDQKSVYVQQASGTADRLRSVDELQTLDTLDGQGLRPNLPDADVEALKEFEKGRKDGDGLFFKNLGLFEEKLNAFEAYNMLQGGKKSIEVRHDIDNNMFVRNMADVRDLRQWVKEQDKSPFTRAQAKTALETLDKDPGVYGTRWPFGRGKITPDTALYNLDHGRAVRVKSPVDNHDDYMYNLRQLQEMDTVRGTGVNPVVPREVGNSLKYLEKGANVDDGLFREGVFGHHAKMDAYEAVEFLLRDRKDVGVRLRGKEYKTHTLQNIQELNALEGDGNNTILPKAEFDALKYFEGKNLFSIGDKQVDAYEAYQAMKSGTGALVDSDGRKAKVLSAADCHELYSLEVSKKNDILPQQQYDLLQYWQAQGTTSKHAPYKVDGNENARAYEALQSIQADTTFEIWSHDRWAPAVNFQDLKDLAAFEGSGFPSDVPLKEKDELEFFQANNERQGKPGFQADGRTGRAYEGYRALRDGRPFDVWAGDTWNSVTDPKSLHELDALLGRGNNDILPQDQYWLLKELGDKFPNEGLASGGRKLNSYKALQEFNHNRPVTYDFHGGDFGDLLQIPTKTLNDMAETKKELNNQKEYDRYRYSVPEFSDKMKRKKAQMPDLAQKNLQFGQSNLASGQSALASGESDLSSGQAEVSRGNSDLSSANSQMMFAMMMPSEIPETRTRTVCDGQNNCHTETYTEYVHNFARDIAMAAAQSAVNSANEEIARGQREIAEAQAEIAEANRRIQEAQMQINDANQLTAMLPSYGQLVDSVDPSSYQAKVGLIQSQIGMMQRLVHIQALQDNLQRQLRLIQNMSRPERPPGWTVPSPLVQF